MTLNIDLEDVPFAILETVKARILANRRRLGEQQAPPPLRKRPPYQSFRGVSNAFRRNEPAAPSLLRDFAFVDAYETYLTTGRPVDPLYSDRTLISAATGNLKSYKVVRVMIQDKNNQCVIGNSELADISLFFGYRTEEFADYVRSGGVLWINNEWATCGYPSQVFNNFLANEFNATIQSDDALIDRGFGHEFSLAYEPLQGKAPPIFYTEYSNRVLGGTPLYSDQYEVCPIAFERIGNGYLVLSGDSNGTTEFPSYPDPNKTFLDALLELRRLRPLINP